MLRHGQRRLQRAGVHVFATVDGGPPRLQTLGVFEDPKGL